MPGQPAGPLPLRRCALPPSVQGAIEQALAEAEARRVEGREITPFLLRRVNEISGGASLRANIALVRHNAAVGAQIASALAQLQGSEAPRAES